MKDYVLALGMFDGVHIGHRALLTRAAELAHENGDTAVAFTFQNHPRELLCGAFDFVSTPALREKLCRSCGIDRVDAVPFTHAFSEQSPDAFVRALFKRYNERIAAIVCGYDFRFGKGAEGDGRMLSALGKAYGFSVEILLPVLYGGEPCSSTRVRAALQNGDVDAANEMLLRPFAIEGTVVHDRALGRTLGFPTANVDYGKQVLPKEGVYATALLFDGEAYAAVTNVGSNPTVGGTKRTVETHVIGRELDLYGAEVAVLFLRRLRDEVRFVSKEALAKQIGADAEAAKKVFEETEKSVYKFLKLW